MQHDRSAPLGFPYEIWKTDEPRHVDRNSHYFKSSYSLRTECERYNSRFKNIGQERMWVRNKSSVTNLNTLAHISLLAVAVAAATTCSGQSYRKLKSSNALPDTYELNIACSS